MKNLTTLSLALAALISAPSTLAHADQGDFTVGSSLGMHVFSDTNELGVRDELDADSQANGALLGLRAGYGLFRELVLEAEVAFTPTEMRDSMSSSTVLLSRVQGLYSFLKPESKLRPFALAGVGFMTTDRSGEGQVVSDTDFVPHAGGGATYRFSDNWSARADLRLLLPPASDSNAPTVDFEAMIGASFAFGIGSTEVTTPSTDDSPITADADGDGIVGSADTCPEQPETANGFEDQDGCPDEAVEADSDGDGINDASDSCKEAAEDMDGFEDLDGCPELDNDKDGIVDGTDECPLKLGPMENRGCPDADRDADGIVDRLDSCPDEKGDVTNRGCA